MIEDLAPWEVAALFQPPLDKQVSVVAPAVASVVPADGTRYALIISIVPPSTGQCQVSVNPNMGTAEGIVPNTAAAPLVITLHDWGPLVQKAWFATNTNPGSSVLQVYSLSVQRWPRDKQRSLILPWEEDATALSAELDKQTRERAAKLRRAIEACGGASPRWLANGD